MSEVDLKTNESELISARDQVLNDLEAETSALFAYEDAGQSNTLKVEMVENMGISDLLLEFNSGRYQYGLSGVKSEGKGLKQVLIIWQGEGTPILRKSACAHHAKDVTTFMKVQFTYNARSEDELDIDDIISGLDQSSKY